MGYYAKPEKQAQRVISWGLALGSGRRNNKSPALIHSISTANAYRSALTTFCKWIQKNRLGNLIQVNVKTCSSFLEERAGQVGQKTLDRDRQAIQYLLGRTTRMKILLPRIKSTYSGGRHLAKQSRAYTRDQVEFISSKLSRRSALATERIAYAAGLRGHELYSLQRRSERGPSVHRKWSNDRFVGRAGIIYTVKGKGGLVREVIIPTQLAKELELRRLPEPVTLRNRVSIISRITTSRPGRASPTSLQKPVSSTLDGPPVPTACVMGMRNCGWMNSIPVSLPARNVWKSSARNSVTSDPISSKPIFDRRLSSSFCVWPEWAGRTSACSVVKGCNGKLSICNASAKFLRLR